MSKQVRVSIIFPYLGDNNEVRRRLCQIIEATLDKSNGLHTSKQKPILVVNQDTVKKKLYIKFEKYLEKKIGKKKAKELLNEKLEVIFVWAVDTCQMWLDGFGKVIDNKKYDKSDDTTAVLQIPGDLKDIRNREFFLDQLSLMSAKIQAGRCDFVIGDFEVEPERSKHLIDAYGTYPLLFNWFPKIAKQLREEYRIKRPRSEFFAVTIDFLSKILKRRKFAYEQTIAFLIYSLSDNATRPRPWRIKKVDIGIIGDYGEKRGFREATDQIERTERMLKLLWREMNGGDEFDVKEFERLDRRSTAIREAAIVSLENFLKK